jgi:hypothetical protein
MREGEVARERFHTIYSISSRLSYISATLLKKMKKKHRRENKSW